MLKSPAPGPGGFVVTETTGLLLTRVTVAPLIAVVIFFSFAYLPYTQQVVSKGQSAQAAAQQIAGVDSSGGRVSQRVSFVPVMQGNRLKALQVQTVIPSSSYQSFYGIMAGDEIEAIGPLADQKVPKGARVRHEKFGAGTVGAAWGLGQKRRITIRFDSAGEKQLVIGFAKLERIR